MRAAVLHGIGNLEIEDVDTPTCGAREVLLRVGAATICRTDLKMYTQGQRDLVLPRILGHEVAGTVVEVGREVTEVLEGERIQVAPGFACGRCWYCVQGRSNLCENISILGFSYDGGFSEYVLLPEAAISSGSLNPIPDPLSFEEAALAEPVACCINGLEMAKIGFDETILIVGGGPIGNIFYHLSQIAGASKVHIVEILPERREFMRRYQIDALDSIESVQDEVDILIPACSDPDALIKGIKKVKRRGKVIAFSGLSVDDPQLLDPNIIHYNELTMVGAYGCTTWQNREALTLMASRKLDLRYLLTDQIPIEKILDGLRMVDAKEGMKVVVKNIRKGG
ncbi:MAG: alcohol dehydrogenase GroES domain-containing protein [Candidatus Syntrophoarchaeum caldarius]|uniref:Alcohol dehydrogenase GroES domain-containing protein n=1 Tax=Candidatus Syntropharchaeum caldarium TaxID=1838285 RepID=A0A1F2P9D8_9EURY|nr:MAG: alcohol dehydrogenase GroES domain-containing protein [Candidatus Syntrophoarchaeum caldarius]